MKEAKIKKEKCKERSYSYSKFGQIDGRHPFQQAVPDGFVPYQARKLQGAKVIFFNFSLAKEMGLIPKNHPDQLNEKLVEAIIDTFSLTIINEYDQINEIEFPKHHIKKHNYMATRYLQIQHEDKTGRTSGDGRSVWNGTVTHGGTSWDISSCGTGATKLSPATSKYKKFFQTGDPSISYGCGCSEVDEGLSALFFSEIFNRNNIATERVLAILEYKNGLAINVRAHHNLLRPSHFFAFLKQSNLNGLTNLIDYYTDKQVENGKWNDLPKSEDGRHKYFLRQMVNTFSKLAATFEDDYIFCWMDWDGDNILMDGGIIDYGSVRQFGLYHQEYRYDDVERFSTSIPEQKKKLRYIVQTFAQIVDFVLTGEKKNVQKFSNHWSVEDFDKNFEYWKNRNLLVKIGFNEKHVDYLVENHLKEVVEFRHSFSYFERAKSKKGKYKVLDGISWDAIFCMRDILRELPQVYLSRMGSNLVFIQDKEFLEILKSNYASAKDMIITPYRKRKVEEFQENYTKLLLAIVTDKRVSMSRLLLEISMRSSVINKYDRVTGDSICNIVDRVLKLRSKLSPEELFKLVGEFSEYQNLDPEKKNVKHSSSSKQRKIVKDFVEIVRYFREGI